MSLTSADLASACRRAAASMRSAEQELNAADGKLGDGDTGLTMRRLFDKVETAAADPPDDVGAFFRAIGLASAGSSGSSLGTLVAIGLLEVGKSTKGRNTIRADEIGSLLLVAEEAMLSRGRASLGDKTVLDAIDAVAAALRADDDDAGATSVTAARAALAEFHGRPCRIGRARMFGERSVGLDDPGMLAFVRLVEAVAEPELEHLDADFVGADHGAPK